ncbi:hypothetical protein FN976_28315 [Caenimonas sedimenti]|uniref:Activator of Hsp90 ATPase homologue 1/2-like C-terminal domain-containing protein n=1 Tax=Caenimonas sedimenti TaxID=2596921 RepID=A0A562ZDJ8_9BURK|nr:SRPBCC domain-containing protein [Caenimonas sedimenti]TWO63993.1 hypothetical protein FN976_28315 [Caenimonas sedimenti]
MGTTTATVSQLIRCSPKEAFDAFVDPAKISRFWLGSASAPLVAQGSATWRFMVPGVEDTVTADELQSPRLIALTWSDGTKLRLTFVDHAGGGTRVSAEFSLSTRGRIDELVNTVEGYSIVLCDLKTFLESGQSAGLVRAKAELIAGGRASS